MDEDSNCGARTNSWARLTGLTLREHDIAKFRDDLIHMWDHIDVDFEASMGNRVVRDPIYNKLEGSTAIKDATNADEVASIRYTPRKYRWARTPNCQWLAISRRGEIVGENETTERSSNTQSAAHLSFTTSNRNPIGPAHSAGSYQRTWIPQIHKGRRT
ncbi:hypothetical protein N9L68_00655 [bacterium]|nr:hypothetical protein [bacterium]